MLGELKIGAAEKKNLAKKMYQPVILLTGFLLYILFIKTYGVNVPYWDEWQLLTVFKGVYLGETAWWKVFGYKHNEHLIGAAFLLMIFQDLISGFGTKAQLYTGALLQFFSLLILYTSLKNLVSDRYKIIWTILVTGLTFSLCQFQNILWGFQTAWFLVTFYFLASLHFIKKTSELTESTTAYLSVGILSAVLATFTSTQGVLIWPSVFLYLLCRDNFNFRKFIENKISKIWCLSALLTGIIYLWIIYIRYEPSPSGNIPITLKLIAAIFFGMYGGFIGNVELRPIIIVGLLVFILASVSLVKVYLSDDRAKYAFPISLILFGALFNILVLIGRMSFGVGVVRDSHYTAYTILILVGSLTIFLQNDGFKSRLISSARNLFIGLMAISLFTSTYCGVIDGLEWRRDKGIAEAVILSPNLLKNDLLVDRLLFGDANYVRKNVYFMKAYLLGAFSEKNRQLSPEIIDYIQMPNSLHDLILRHPQQAIAITEAWYAYISDGGLRRAFNPVAPEFSEELIRWCYIAAEDGKHHLSKYLKPFASDYQRLVSVMNNGKG